MSKIITVSIKYEDDQEQPEFHAHMKILGGVIDTVAFYDVFEKIEELEHDLEVSVNE